MPNYLEKSLLQYKRNTITIDELTRLSANPSSYAALAEQVTPLEDTGVLTMIKATGRNTRTPALAYRYKINKHLLRSAHHKTLQLYRQTLHNEINLDAYFHLDVAVWERDLPYLEKISQYIQRHGFPKEKEPAPGRSFALVGDEKWMEQGGAEVLYRIGLWEKMMIFPVSDPLMMAINPQQVHHHIQSHLIVENKTTYQALVPVLAQTPYATLIYGVGNKITKSIENFANQYPVEADHTFYYFGDLDRSGIQIWYSLQQRQENMVPAIAFYQACLQKKEVYGKTNQRCDAAALEMFSSYFQKEVQQQISHILNKGAYYPQEALQTTELQQIFQQHPQMEVPYHHE